MAKKVKSARATNLPARATGPPPGMISIGALSKASGIPAETLRTWERRYGFPAPVRKRSGHRLYPIEGIARLRSVAEAIALGHRVGDVITAREEDLRSLLREARAAAERSAEAGRAAALLESGGGLSTGHEAEVTACEREVAAFDGLALTRRLFSAWARLGPIPFLDQLVAPLLHRVGESWKTGRLEIRHEHFCSERISDLLRSLRLPLEERAGGPLAILATPAGEAHGLGLEMAALVLAHAGWRTLYLGTEVPEEQVASLAREHRAAAVGLSLSLHARRPRFADRVRALSRLLPAETMLVLGGAGAVAVPEAERMESLGALDLWARRHAGRHQG